MSIEFKEEDKDFFIENGYLIYKNFFSADDISIVRNFVNNIDFNTIDPRY